MAAKHFIVPPLGSIATSDPVALWLIFPVSGRSQYFITFVNISNILAGARHVAQRVTEGRRPKGDRGTKHFIP